MPRSLRRCGQAAFLYLTEPLVTDSAVFLRAKRLFRIITVTRDGKSNSMRVQGFYGDDPDATQIAQGRICTRAQMHLEDGSHRGMLSHAVL